MSNNMSHLPNKKNRLYKLWYYVNLKTVNLKIKSAWQMLLFHTIWTTRFVHWTDHPNRIVEQQNYLFRRIFGKIW